MVFCNKPNNFIIETDIEKITLNASKNGLTVEENERLGLLIVDSLKKNTIGKTLPNIIVSNVTNQKLNLLDELDKVNHNFILISSDIYCGFGLECISNLFPKAFEKFSSKNKDIPAYCLVKRTESDISDSVRFYKTVNELNPYYTAIFIIEDKEANKLNLGMNPTRLYLTEQNVVTNITFGINVDGDLYDEIEQNIKVK